MTTFISLLNEGIAGGRLLHDSLGPSGLARFDRDVLAQTGATHVIVQMGNNDIFTINPAEEVTADQIMQGHKQLIERAHAQGLKIYGCTLNPVEGFLLPGTPIPVYSAAKEVKRQMVNGWSDQLKTILQSRGAEIKAIISRAKRHCMLKVSNFGQT